MNDSAGMRQASQTGNSSLTETYADGLRKGVLKLLGCDSCGRAMFYPRLLCPHCGATTLSWQVSDGRGVVYSVTQLPGEEGNAGPNIVLVDLDEGVRLASTVPGAVPKIGDPVRFDPAQSGGENPRPVFALGRDGQ